MKNVVVPITQCLAAAVVGEAFIATHMTWGAINEWSTWAGYDRLIALERNPALTAILRKIMRQETRHVAFYATEARRRLTASRRAQWITRWALQRFWTPVGSSVMPEDETRFLLGHLLNGPEGDRALAHIDKNIDRLPGLAGLHLVRRKIADYGVGAWPARPTSS